MRATAFNDSLSKFVANLSVAEGQANAALNRLELAVGDCADLKLMPELLADLTASVSAAIDSMEETRALAEDLAKATTGNYPGASEPVAKCDPLHLIASV